MTGKTNIYLNRVVDTAIAEIGKQEDPAHTNRGYITKYSASVGYPSGGVPWCAAFVNYCFSQAALGMSLPNTWIRTASCVTIKNWAQDNDILQDKPTKEPCVFLYYSVPSGEEYKRACHTGIVTDASETLIENPGKKFWTIEGNTNPGGGRDGYGVFRRWRMVSQHYKFVNIAKLLENHTEYAFENEKIPLFNAIVPIKLNGVQFTKGYLQAGNMWVSVKDVADKVGLELAFDELSQSINFIDPKSKRKKPLISQLNIVEGRSFAKLRDITNLMGLAIKYDPITGVDISREYIKRKSI